MAETIAAPTNDVARARGVTWVMAIGWIVWMYLHVWRRHDRFGTFDNDLGFHTQYIWLIARGRWFSTILGLPAFGHNATFGYLLLAPLSWLGAGPHIWNLIQAISVGLGAVVLQRLGARVLGRPWLGAALGLVWLLQPVVQGNVWETFHPESMAMTPLLCAYSAADDRRWRRFLGWALLAVIWKTDVALFLVMLGALIIWRERRAKRPVRAAVAFTLGAFLWFAVVVGLMIPRLSGGGTVFGPLYGDLGDSPTQVLTTSARHPTKLYRHLRAARPVRYGRDLLAPMAFVPLLGPAGLFVGAPQFAVSLLSDREFTRDPVNNPHYQALPVTALAIASVEGLRLLQRRRAGLLVPALATMVASGLALSAVWGALPIGIQHGHFWGTDGDPTRSAKLAALDYVGPDAVVSATYLFVPHLAERKVVYSFPNPWRKVFYGVDGTPAPDPSRVRYLVIEQALLGEADRALARCLLDRGVFRLVPELSGADVWVAERARPGGGPASTQVAENACANLPPPS